MVDGRNGGHFRYRRRRIKGSERTVILRSSIWRSFEVWSKFYLFPFDRPIKPCVYGGIIEHEIFPSKIHCRKWRVIESKLRCGTEGRRGKMTGCCNSNIRYVLMRRWDRVWPYGPFRVSISYKRLRTGPILSENILLVLTFKFRALPWYAIAIGL